MRPQRIRSGVTLIELIVVLAGIMFLLSLVLPAIFRLRVGAGKTQGKNNLHQIVLASHTHQDVHGRLPPVIGEAAGKHGTIFYHVLPFLEEAALHKQGDVWTAETMDERLRFLLDSRDKSAPPGNVFQGWLATSNYAGNWLVFGKPRTLNQITDGTSNTIAFAERYQVCNGTPCAWAYDRLYYWAPVFAYYSVGKFQLAPAQADCDPTLSQSLDSSGLLVGMCDGSVQVAGPHTSPSTWHALLTPNKGDQIVDFP